MKKLVMLAAMLAMALVAAAPAMAQTVEGDTTETGDDATTQIQSAEQVQYSINVLAAETDTENNIGGDVGDGNAIGGGNVEAELVNESSQVLQQAQADDGSFAANAGGLYFYPFFFWF